MKKISETLLDSVVSYIIIPLGQLSGYVVLAWLIVAVKLHLLDKDTCVNAIFGREVYEE